MISKFIDRLDEMYLLRDEFIFKLLPDHKKIGKWWYLEEEIDIVALNEESMEIFFFECKWSRLNKKEGTKILENLKRKAALVNWYNDGRKEHFGIIARNLSEKESLREKGYLAFDLEDIEAQV